MSTKTRWPWGIEASRLLLVFMLACFIGAAAVHAQGWTEPVAPELWNERLEIGPVPGLTTIWHQAPVRTAIPLGSTVRFRIQAPPSWSVRWAGAREIERNTAWSIAEGEFGSLGASTVSVAYDDGSGEQIEERTVFDVLNTTTPATVGFERISVAAIHLTAGSVMIDPQNPNTSSLNYFVRNSSVAALRQIGEGHYSTSINRTLVLEAEVQPSGFAPLIEWRLDGKPQRQLGSPLRFELYTTGPHTLSAGPPTAEKQVQLDTYSVRITSDQRAVDILENVPVTFRAKTDPPGYEGDITWVIGTKYGSARPWMGKGPEHTVVFEDTRGAEGRWLGIRADNWALAFNQREPQPLPPGVLHATIDVTCASGRSFTISTGTSGGSCTSGGEKGTSTCTDGGAIVASVDCGSDGKGQCSAASGAGSCTIKK